MLAAMELLSQLWLHIAYIKLKCVKSQASPDPRPLSSQASPDPCPLSSQASPDHLHARIESGIARPLNRVKLGEQGNLKDTDALLLLLPNHSELQIWRG